MPDTMTVIINGKEEQRTIDHVEVVRHRSGIRQPSKPIPVLREGEWMTEALGGKVHIHKL